MLFGFTDNGSDQDTVEYLEKARVTAPRKNCVLRDVVTKDGKTVKRWCKAGTDQSPKQHFNPQWDVKHRDSKDKRRPQTDARTGLFFDVAEKMFYDTQTSLGTDIQFINHSHLDENRVERRFNDVNFLQSVKSILKDPVGVHAGKNTSGTTEYYGFEQGHEGDPRYGVVVVVLDNYEPTGKGQLQTIMPAQRIDPSGRRKSSGLNREHRELLMKYYNDSQKGDTNNG